MADRDPESRSQFADHTHAYIREYIQLADQKAAFIFAASSGILAFIYGKNSQHAWLRNPAAWGVREWLAAVAMASLALATLAALAVVVPRRRGSPHGYIFWEAVADYQDSTAYSNAVIQLSSEALTRETLHHCYELAKVCRRKYRALDTSLRLGALGSAASVIYLLAF